MPGPQLNSFCEVVTQIKIILICILGFVVSVGKEIETSRKRWQEKGDGERTIN